MEGQGAGEAWLVQFPLLGLPADYSDVPKARPLCVFPGLQPGTGLLNQKNPTYGSFYPWALKSPEKHDIIRYCSSETGLLGKPINSLVSLTKFPFFLKDLREILKRRERAPVNSENLELHP